MKMEKRNLEQRCAIKFCVNLNENATETYKKLKRAYGEHAVSRTQVFRWHEAFLDGHESAEDEPHSGRPCSVIVYRPSGYTIMRQGKGSHFCS